MILLWRLKPIGSCKPPSVQTLLAQASPQSPDLLAAAPALGTIQQNFISISYNPALTKAAL